MTEIEAGARRWHGPDGYGWVVVVSHNPATDAVQVTQEAALPSPWAGVHLVRAADLHPTEPA